jgi:purine-nucleoside/S-methyl-5'-thioadenosine phosphorylase / adenosine deaminase
MTHLRWNVPGDYEVVFTTRFGGVSEGPYASLNLGRKTGDEVERVDENRRRACAEIGADAERLALNYQMHSAVMQRARPGVRGEPGDGLWTDERDLPVLAMSADCVPVALARLNGAEPAVAVVHVGWRGLLADMIESAVLSLGGCDLAAAVGPAIGPCCYEVRDDVAEPFRARFGREIVSGGRLDLWRAAGEALRQAGVARVERFDLCTACHPELFFSHRRDGKPRGVQGVLARVA